MTQEKLIQELIQKTRYLIEEANQLMRLPSSKLHAKKEEKSWNALECIEHLNRYSDFYIDEFNKKIEKAKKVTSQKHFNSGFLGNYFAKSMLPSKKMMHMKTFAEKNPLNDELSDDVLKTFLLQQNKLLELLEKAKEVELSRTKCNLTLPLLKLKLGDTLRFYVNVSSV